MNAPVILALTSHGNAPYLMAVALAERLGAQAIILPDYYGASQRQILLENCAQFASRIFLSADLGALFRPLLLDAQPGRSYRDLASNATDPQSPDNADQIEAGLARWLEKGIPAVALDGSQARTFRGEDFTFVLNITLPIRTPIRPVVSLFTGKMSQVYGTPAEQRPSPEVLCFIAETRPYAGLWERVEDQFDLAFIPRLHVLSHAQKEVPGVNLTPPLALPKPELLHRLSKPAVLFQPSGTRTDILRLRKIAATMPDDSYSALTLNGLRRETDLPESQFSRVTAGVYGDPLLAGVIFRGGWGTLWQCLVHLKPMGVVSSTFQDDPEIAHSIATLRATGLGVELRNSAMDLLQERVLEPIRVHLAEMQAEDRAIFGDYALDGFGFTAREISQYFSPEICPECVAQPSRMKSHENGVE